MAKTPPNHSTYYEEAFGTLLLIGAALVAFLQGIGEVIYWLRFGEWLGLDTFYLFPDLAIRSTELTDWVGLNQVILFVLDMWISVPIAVVMYIVGRMLLDWQDL